jgi:tetratricopeptide (TPR) repeat protein
MNISYIRKKYNIMKKFIIAVAFVLGIGITAHAQQQSANEARHQALVDMGGQYLEKKEFKKAIEAYDEALGYNVEVAQTMELRAMAYMLNKDYAEAIRDLDKLIGNGDKLAQLYFIRSSAKLGLQDQEGACLDMKKAVENGHKISPEGFAAICGE